MPEEPNGACQLCDEIWREYARATAKHVKLIMDRQLATLDRDHEAEVRLDPRVAVAETVRADAREKLREHEAGHNWKLLDFDFSH